MQNNKLRPLAVAILAASVFPAMAAEQTELDALVVTAPAMSKVLKVETDPKAPRQPIPAQDGADLLKNIPGFSVIRKGGTDGDPVFRGMAASRLSILMDGENVLGGCGNRMDPPTAYIFPEAYDNVTILKGPQSVKYGPGSSAGVVNFERATPDFYDQAVHGYASALVGSFGRNDQVGQLQAGGEKGYIELKGMRSESRDYKDGAGDKVHSNYERWSSNATLGWTPNLDTKVELTAALSDGEAAYGDRSMDGAQFRRENIGLSYQQEHLSDLVTQVKARIYRNYVDHVMDNYSLREVPEHDMPMAMNPDRESLGGAFSSTLTFDAHRKLDIGVDYQQDQHSDRMGGKDYKNSVRENDIKSQNAGIYTEFHRHYPGDHELHLGLRFDHNKTEDQRHMVSTSGDTDSQWLTSGFIRYEHQLDPANRAYVGIGHSQRAPDYWERTRTPDGSMSHDMGDGHGTDNEHHPAASSFNVKAEKLTQLDIGIVHSHENLQASISGFYAYHNDYILIEKLDLGHGSSGTNARNINATTFGGEADIVWRFMDNWNTLTALSYVQGKNRSDDRALGQISAPELRLGLNYDNEQWTAGVLWRGVAHQHRIAIDQGSIVGQDISPSSGFGVFSLNAGYRASKNLIFTAGIDNLLDRNYAEHLSKGDPNGLTSASRVNELGRNMWLKAQYKF